MSLVKRMLLYSSPRWFVPDLLLVPHSERPCGAGARRREGSERCGKTSGSRLSAHSTDELPGLSGYWWIHKGCGMHLSAISKCTPTSTWETRRFRSVCLCFFFFLLFYSCRWQRSSRTSCSGSSVALKSARSQSSSTWAPGCRCRLEVK